MKYFKLLFLAAILLFAGKAGAQQKFTGTVEYKLTQYNKNKPDDQPYKMVIAYGKDKIGMRASFTNRPDQMIIINTVNDTLYMTDDNGKKIYEKDPLNGNGFGGMIDFAVEKTDSFRTLFGYRCRGYRINIDPGAMGEKKQFAYCWAAEELIALPLKDNYHHLILEMLHAQHVMLAMDMYENDQRDGSFVATDMKKMDDVPGSYFDLSGYTESKENIMASVADTLSMADTTAVVPAISMPKRPVPHTKPAPAPKKPVRSKKKTAALEPERYALPRRIQLS